jgi:hypothetical protein
MAQEITIDINIVTNAAPAAAKISKDLDGIKRKAKEVKDDLDAAFEDDGKGDGKIKQGTDDVNTLKNALSPIKGLINDLTGGMSDAFFQAFQSVKATTTAIKGLDLALKTAAFGIAILAIQEAIKLYEQLVVTEEEEAAALTAATTARENYNKAIIAGADAIDKERKAREGGVNSIRREIAELEASGATAEQVFKKKKDLNAQERLDLITRLEAVRGQAEAEKDVQQALLDNASAARALDLSEDKRVRELKAANAAKSKADREKERQEEFTRLNEINQRVEKDRQLMEDATATTNAAIEAQSDFSIENLEFYQTQLEELTDEEVWALEERNIRIARARKADTDAADKANKETLDKEKAYRQQLQDLATDSALGTISALKELNSIFDADNEEAAKKSFNRNKALSIAETLISTFVAAQKAYASQLTLTPDAPIRAAIAAGIAVVGGLARVAAISATKFNSGSAQATTPSVSSAAGGGGGGGSIPAPQFNIVGQSGTNQLAQGIGGQFAQPIRAYVVGQDVTTSQQLQRQRVRTATFG